MLKGGVYLFNMDKSRLGSESENKIKYVETYLKIWEEDMSGFYDIHTHILPHVDDGAADMKETMRLLKMEYNDGVRTIYATSHFRRNMFEPSMEKVHKQYELVAAEAAKEFKDLRILLGCEFHVNSDMVETLDAGERPGMGGTRCVLAEFSERSDANTIQNKCYELLSHGYQPIIAHAERYPAIRKNLDFLEQLVDMGNYIQMNADSIVGNDGLSMKWYCKKAMKKDLIHFVGSDAHNTKDRKPAMGKCAAYLEKTMGKAYMKKILIENPRELIEEGR